MNYTVDTQSEKTHLLVSLVIAFALVGVIDAGYLTYSHYTHTIVECALTGGCQDVLESAYATLFGIPVALFGVLFYITVLGTIALYKKTNFDILRKGLLVLTGTGFLASLYFVYLQLFVLESICLYCMGSATTSTILFIITILLNRAFKNKEKESIS